MVIHKLIGPEQAGFLAGRSTFDNILTVQEVVNSLENDLAAPPRMILKLDIEKAYDTLEWNAILATLVKMNFPGKWIEWIKACITSPSFAFLINGQPSSWSSSSRGIRQGDPLSSFLFILVSQNLSSMLNKALNLNLIPGFDSRIPRNFNHLMFADDLIIITNASRATARNCSLCLNIFSDFSGQRVNPAKSSILSPSWCNSRILHAISNILCFKIESFPFTYLGVLISPKKLTVNQCNPIVARVASTISNWNHSNLSLAGRAVLINSSLLSLPLYYLAVQALPDSIINKIEKLVRDFLWNKGGNRSGFHTIGWSTVLSNKSEGGLGIRNLRFVRAALMSKNALAILNAENKIWVDLFNWKYGLLNVWQPSKCPKASGLYFSILKIIQIIRPNLWIKEGHPNGISFWDDPWCFSIPLSCKPTYLNMTLAHQDFSFLNIVSDNHLNLEMVSSLLGPHLDLNQAGKFSCSPTPGKNWVWLPFTPKASISSSIYNYLSDNASMVAPWRGWRAIWELPVAPRVKTFIWQLAHGKLSTYSYLYNLKLGPNLDCTFCNLGHDSSVHFLWNCNKTRSCWLLLAEYSGFDVNLLHSFADLSWLFDELPIQIDLRLGRALIATCCWLIWKARCNSFYRNESPNFPLIFSKVIKMAHEYYPKFPCQTLLREVPPPSSFLSFNLFTDASWINSSSWAGLGFVVTDNLNRIIFAGCSGAKVDSPLHAEAAALEQALLSCKAHSFIIHQISTDCASLEQLLRAPDPTIAWRFETVINCILSLLEELRWPRLSVINRQDNFLADRLAAFGRSNPARSLFFQGLELPRWLAEVSSSGPFPL